MLEDGQFYPYKTMSAEERLWWYSRFFDAVEVNSTSYALPSPDTAVPSAIIASGNYSYGDDLPTTTVAVSVAA
jgi:hypothetical protein